MRLADALSRASDEQLRRIAAETDPGFHELPPAQLASRLETVLHSASHIEVVLAKARPPVLSLMILLLENGLSAGVEECRTRATADCELLCKRVSSGELVASDGCALYRRVLAAAWRSDLMIDASEVTLLGVLRHELGMTP